MWVELSILSAFGQALGWALKKKTLENKGVNNTLGAVSFLVAGTLLFVLWGFTSNWHHLPITESFVDATLIVIGVNVLAIWSAYRALDKTALSTLMPFMALTSLGIVPVEYMLRGVVPNLWQIIGIASVVCGAIIFAAKNKPTKNSLAAIGYFGVTLFCYSIAPPFMAVAVEESRSGLFSAAVFHLGIAIGFVPLVLRAKEYEMVRALQKSGEWSRILLLMAVAGFVIACIENGPATVALENAKASEVFALKRVMPLFALILGVIMFGERIEKRHLLGTAMLVLGPMFVVWFRE